MNESVLVVSGIVNTLQTTEEKVIIRVEIEIRSLRNMKNKIIAVYKIANRLVSITVEEPDFSNLKMNQFVEIGGKRILKKYSRLINFR